MRSRAVLLLAGGGSVAGQPVPVTPAPPSGPPQTPPFSKYTVKHPDRFRKYLDLNKAVNSRMPLSYNVPEGYFEQVPPGLKRTDNNPDGTYVAKCVSSKYSMPGKPPGTISADRMNEYEFYSEKVLASGGLDIYDAAVWSIAQTLLDNTEDPMYYTKYILWASRTPQLGDLRGAKQCKGIMYDGACDDPSQNGECGLCYGDSGTTVQRQNALLFRLISDIWAFQGTTDVRCPDVAPMFTWNDYKPILGENAWANFLGPLTVALKKWGSPAAIPTDSAEFQVAIATIPALKELRCSAPVGQEGHGALYYCPHNAFFYEGSTNPNAGSTVSIENSASQYAAFKALYWVLNHKPGYEKMACEVKDMMDGLEDFILSSWDGTYFRQGGTYDRVSKKWTWGQAGQPDFAVDCQTWVTSVLGPKKIDSVLGPNTTFNLWKTLKYEAGYGVFNNGSVKGVGYSARPDSVYPSNETMEVSPQIEVIARIKFADFDEADYKNRASYVLGVPDTSMIVQDKKAYEGGNKTRLLMVFIRIGDESALDVATDYVKYCTTPGTPQYNHVFADGADFQEVFSGEWTFGAISMARMIANASIYSQEMVDEIIADADFMRQYIEHELVAEARVQNGYEKHWGVLYGSARYYVPFGWWSNPVQSTASTGWAVAVDLGWNPLMINGAYDVDYPATGTEPTCPGSYPAPPAQLPLPSGADLPFAPPPHDVLTDLYQATTGSEWFVPAWWEDPFTYNPCGNVSMGGSIYPYTTPWNGISCDLDGRVVALELANNNLEGTIPKSIGYLSDLVSIVLKTNKIHGSLPEEIGMLTRLESLEISNNQLEGTLPATFGNLTRLKYMWLTNNKISGSIPASFAQLTNMVVLNINNNQLTGLNDTLPWTQYQNCDLSGNPFKCPVPSGAENNCYAFCM